MGERNWWNLNLRSCNQSKGSMERKSCRMFETIWWETLLAHYESVTLFAPIDYLEASAVCCVFGCVCVCFVGFWLVACCCHFEASQVFCIIPCMKTLQQDKSSNDRQRPELDRHRHFKKMLRWMCLCFCFLPKVLFELLHDWLLRGRWMSQVSMLFPIVGTNSKDQGEYLRDESFWKLHPYVVKSRFFTWDDDHHHGVLPVFDHCSTRFFAAQNHEMTPNPCIDGGNFILGRAVTFYTTRDDFSLGFYSS